VVGKNKQEQNIITMPETRRMNFITRSATWSRPP